MMFPYLLGLLLMSVAVQAGAPGRDVGEPPILLGKRCPLPPLAGRGARAWHHPVRASAAIGTNRLLTHAVADSSARSWWKRVKTFLSHVKVNSVPFQTSYERDVALADYMSDLCYLERQGYSAGVQLLAGWCHFFPEDRGRLPLAGRASSSWVKLAAPLEGGPLPPEAIGVMALTLVHRGCFQAALGVLMAFDGFLRGQDIFALRGGDLIRDASGFALALGRRVRGQRSKTGTDQGVILDRRWLGYLLGAWVDKLGDGEPWWTIEASTYRRQWKEAQEEAGLTWLGPAHSVRHSGPALQALQGRRTLEGIRRRGRWASLGSVQRYTKTHKLVEARARLGAEDRARGVRFFEDPVKALEEAAASAPRSVERRRFLRCLGLVGLRYRGDDTLTWSQGLSAVVQEEDEPRAPRQKKKKPPADVGE
jgi:hypothetical protein